jgi:hypothetical protein
MIMSKNENKVRFDKTKVGVIFDYNDSYYLKIRDSEKENVFNLALNAIESFPASNEVYPRQRNLPTGR